MGVFRKSLSISVVSTPSGDMRTKPFCVIAHPWDEPIPRSPWGVKRKKKTKGKQKQKQKGEEPDSKVPNAHSEGTSRYESGPGSLFLFLFFFYRLVYVT
jgi:hypothetical protein